MTRRGAGVWAKSTSSIAGVMLIYMALSGIRRVKIDMLCLDTIAQYLFYAFLVDFALETLDLIHRIYEAGESFGALDFMVKPIDPDRASFVGSAVTCLCAPGDNLAIVAALALLQHGVDLGRARVVDRADVGAVHALDGHVHPQLAGPAVVVAGVEGDHRAVAPARDDNRVAASIGSSGACSFAVLLSAWIICSLEPSISSRWVCHASLIEDINCRKLGMFGRGVGGK